MPPACLEGLKIKDVNIRDEAKDTLVLEIKRPVEEQAIGSLNVVAHPPHHRSSLPTALLT
jgi:hypothetical protein